MKFICDDNLGKLAKYLRLLGFDVYFDERPGSGDLLRVAASQGRLLLSRNRRLLDKSHPYGILLIECDDPLTQLNKVVKGLTLNIEAEKIFTRCSRCNEICRRVDKNDIGSRTFPFIIKTQEMVSECPSCKRLYWKGTHYSRLLELLKAAIPNENIIGHWPS